MAKMPGERILSDSRQANFAYILHSCKKFQQILKGLKKRTLLLFIYRYFCIVIFLYYFPISHPITNCEIR